MAIARLKAAKYPSKSFAPIAKLAWKKFFQTASAEVDVAHWLIQPNSSVIELRPRPSTMHESNAAYDELPSFFISVNGFIEIVKKLSDDKLDAAEEDFIEWGHRGILDAFQSPEIQRYYQRSSQCRASFAIVSARWDESLIDADLTIIWSNNERFGVAEIKRRQIALAKERQRIPPIVKKKPMRKKRPLAKKLSVKKKQK